MRPMPNLLARSGNHSIEDATYGTGILQKKGTVIFIFSLFLGNSFSAYNSKNVSIFCLLFSVKCFSMVDVANFILNNFLKGQ
jgi:hypothetical protein